MTKEEMKAIIEQQLKDHVWTDTSWVELSNNDEVKYSLFEWVHKNGGSDSDVYEIHLKLRREKSTKTA